MQFIPQDTTITVGDVVITSGLGGKIPEGLILGTVQSIQAEPSAPFLTATILPVHDPREWTSVIVLPFPGK
jgi:rod shape-determining protein MreC